MNTNIEMIPSYKVAYIRRTGTLWFRECTDNGTS